VLWRSLRPCITIYNKIITIITTKTTTTIIIKHLTDFPGAVEKFEAVQAKWGGEASLV
jgi:hypothetical protein